MTPLKVFGNIRSIEKSVHLLVVSPAKLALSPEFRQASPLHIFYEGELFDAICETPACLPDAIQILTPCTIGNGWLSIAPFGKFAVTLYEKYTGKGVRVFLDIKKLEAWPEVRDWYLKKKKKRDQDSDLLMTQIKAAGHSLLGIQQVLVAPEKVRRKKMGPSGICPVCGEAYPIRDGYQCRSCQGDAPYTNIIANHDGELANGTGTN